MPKKMELSEILIKDSTYSNTNRLKKRLLEEKILQPICSIRSIGDVWNGKYLSLHIDHINGINNDHRIENLRILCPNCHSQTDTYAGKNTKGKRPAKEIKQYYCLECSSPIGDPNRTKAKTGLCQPCIKIKRRVAVRPPLETLKMEVEKLGYVKTAKKYGVSNRSIKKWIENYKK